jgi:hypothetical protein
MLSAGMWHRVVWSVFNHTLVQHSAFMVYVNWHEKVAVYMDVPVEVSTMTVFKMFIRNAEN